MAGNTGSGSSRSFLREDRVSLVKFRIVHGSSGFSAIGTGGSSQMRANFDGILRRMCHYYTLAYIG